MNPLNLLSASYLFNPTPGQDFKYLWICLVFFLLLVVLGQYWKTFTKNHEHKKILKKIFPGVANKLTTFALFGFAFLFFRHENIPYMAMRILLLAVIIWTLVYIGKNLRKYFKILPTEIAKKAKKEDLNKYMPKPKKKRKKRR
ncbi:hypothetical protein KJ764_06355 [Patescibacteria group bacterium]|nr:hypothetical protein [Patescibacteria group bacterium]